MVVVGRERGRGKGRVEVEKNEIVCVGLKFNPKKEKKGKKGLLANLWPLLALI